MNVGLPRRRSLLKCGSCYLGPLAAVPATFCFFFLPFTFFLFFFYAFHFHVQFRIWRTLSLKDCTWKFYGRCSSFWPHGPLLAPFSVCRSRVPPGLVSYCQLAGWLADWHYVAFFWWSILWWLWLRSVWLQQAHMPHATRPPTALLYLARKWNVKCNPAAAKCHVYLPARELASEPANHSASQPASIPGANVPIEFNLLNAFWQISKLTGSTLDCTTKSKWLAVELPTCQ